MNIILLSGGSGKRLWPLSNDIRSKQFIKIFKTADGYESMVQRVYRQIKEVDADASVTIATSKTQVSSIHNQLDNSVGVCVEPCRRDTFPAIALATAYLHDVKGVGLDAAVVVCPVDPYVNNDYFAALKTLSELAGQGNANLSLMGIEPTYPSEKYGYIIPQSADAVSPVKTFKEKPDAATAEKYIAQGALWNGGVFAYKLRYVLDKAHELIDFTDYKDLFDKYETLKKISFDYAVDENESHSGNALCGPVEGYGHLEHPDRGHGGAEHRQGYAERHLPERPCTERAGRARALHGAEGRRRLGQPGGHFGL